MISSDYQEMLSLIHSGTKFGKRSKIPEHLKRFISKPTWFSSSQRKAQEREKQLRKQKLKRNNRLELVLKLFREVDGKFKHAANVSIEKRFGVDNRARFVCLKKDKLGVWRM